MKLFLLVLIEIALVVRYGSAQSGTYTITAPNTMFANTGFRVALSNHGSGANSPAIKADVRVIGQETADGKFEGNAVSAAGVISVPVKTTKNLVLKIGNWKPGNYRLEINGTGGVKFFRTATLNFNDKQFSILIQTDKAIYQLGQIVHFRIVTVNSKLLPYKNGRLLVYINDGQNNRIKQWNITVPQSGIFSNELQLSDQPVKGMWQIVASSGDQSTSSSFEVTEYTLPRFDVTVEPPSFITADTIQFPVTVNAEYTFGGAVSGSYLVNITETYCTYAYATNCQSRPVVLKGNFKGKVTVTVKVGDLYLTKSSLYGGSFTVLAIVTEEFTGITRNSTATFQRYDQREKLTIEQESSFKPHMPFSVTVRLLQQDDVPVTNATGKLNATVTYDSDLISDNLLVDFKKDGSATFTFDPPTDATSLSVVAVYKSLTVYGSASIAQSLSDKYISISVKNAKPKIGDTLQVVVASTFTLVNPISYQVVGRGNIQIAKTIQLATGNQFSFAITTNMAPHARIVVFYVTDCGEIIGDSLDVSIDGAIRNNVSLHLSNTTAEPGNEVTITVSSSPNSLVALNSVDKSVLLLRAGNDITKEQVINEMQQYDIGTGIYYDNYYAGIIRRPSGGSFDEVFTLAGLILLTNGLYYKAATCYGGPIFYAKALVGSTAAFDGGGQGGGVQPTYVRKYFPEVWIWTNVTTKANGKYELKLKVPDTITTWEINGFALSKSEGLGLTDRPSNVVVTLNKTGNISEYDIAEETGDRPNELSKSVKIASNDVQAVTFRIQPTVVGYISLNVKAVSAYAGDALIAQLLVKAEGSPQYYNKAVFVNLRNSSSKTYSTTIAIHIPKEAVPNSQFIEFVAMGDIMAQVIANLKNLIRLPSGCGEQNMINFAPDVVILRYLERINELSQEFKSTAISYLETGYQTQLTYKHSDGSFSAFGQSDNYGSTWLTAFVVKSFVQAVPYITIDPDVIKQAKDFLVSKQLSDGQFKEDGIVLHKALQGGSSSSGIALTAYVIISFLEDKGQSNIGYTDAIKNGVQFLETNANSIDNTYDLIITTYALQLANSSLSNQLFNKMNAQKITEGDLVHWTYPVPRPNGTDWYYDIPASYDVEITAYAELVNILRGLDIDDRLPVIRWLLSKRNDLGGFSSSQDSVIGIQALGEDAPTFATAKDAELKLIITYLTNESLTFILNKDNSLVLQKAQLPKEVRSVQIEATGNGVGIAQVSWNYNIVKAGSSNSPSFKLNPVVTRTNDNSYSVRICSWYLLKDTITTNMVVLEFNTLSGYTLDEDTLPAAGYVDGLKRFDVKQSSTLVVFYFDSLPKTPNTLCFTVNANKLTEVEELKDAMITVYDYYENSKRAEAFYNLPKVS